MNIKRKVRNREFKVPFNKRHSLSSQFIHRVTTTTELRLFRQAQSYRSVSSAHDDKDGDDEATQSGEEGRTLGAIPEATWQIVIFREALGVQLLLVAEYVAPTAVAPNQERETPWT